MDQDIREALAAVEKAGWRTRRGKHGVIVYPPNGGRPIPLHQSRRSSRLRASNAIVQLRRAGLDL